MALYAPFKERLVAHPARDYVIGGVEAVGLVVCLVVFNRFHDVHRAFTVAVATLYAANQLSRMYRQPAGPANVEELRELVGFMGIFAAYLFWFLAARP